jgi:hypothetical protein
MGAAIKGATGGVAGISGQLQDNQIFLDRPEIKRLLRGYWKYVIDEDK